MDPRDCDVGDYDMTVSGSGADLAVDPTKPKRKPRRKHDAYPTVDELATAIVERVAAYCPMPERIVEPTAGDGAFVKALRKRYFADTKIGAIDLLAQYAESCLAAGANKFVCSDFLALPPEALAEVDLIIGNPPFNIAAAIVSKCVREAPKAMIAFLLPVGFIGRTKERNDAFWRANRVNYYAALHPRPSFTGDGKTDRMEYALFGFGQAWLNANDGTRIGEPLVWRPE